MYISDVEIMRHYIMPHTDELALTCLANTLDRGSKGLIGSGLAGCTDPLESTLMEFRAQVKKQSGSLVLESKYLLWKTDAGASETVDLTTVAGMKATPPTSASCRILLAGANGPIMKLEFANRDSLDRAKEAIQQAIQTVRADGGKEGSSTPKADTGSGNNGSGVSAVATSTQSDAQNGSQAESQGASGNGPPAKRQKKAKFSLDPQKLLANYELQRTALQKDHNLQRTFQETVVKGQLTNEQFWSMRIDHLITAAQEASQSRGAYNVLSTIKPVTGSDNQINLSLTRDKIHDIFDQYPIVRKAYNDNVPKMSEGEFWQKFFMSRFFLQLRGERISNNHPWDPHLDKYIDILEESIRKRKAANTDSAAFIPMYLDVNGNQNDVPELSQAPSDPTMRIGGIDAYGPSLIRQFNGLSKKLVSGGKPQKPQQKESIFKLGDDAVKYDKQLMDQIKLTDLQIPEHDGDAINLHLRNDNQTNHHTVAKNYDACRKQLVGELTQDIELNEVMYYEEDELNATQQRIEGLLKAQSQQMDTNDEALGVLNDREVMICHATTLEFLRQYMDARSKNVPLDSLKECLTKSLDRIAAVKEKSAQPEATAEALEPLERTLNKVLSF